MMPRSKSVTITAAALAAVVFVLPASAQRSRETLAERVARLEQQAASAGDQETQRTLSDLLLRLDDLQSEVQSLRGLVENQSFELDQIKTQQQDQYLDLDRRLSDVSRGGGQDSGSQVVSNNVRTYEPVPTTVVGNGGGNSSASTQPVSTDRPEVRAPIEAGLQTTGLGSDPNQSVAAVANPAAEKAAYDVAFDALKQGRYAESARRFDEFLKAFPDGEYADNAQYWLAESYYVTGNYRIALDAFQTLTSKFPNSSKAQDATLKLAFTYYELKQWDEAERTLNQVLQQFPNTTVARLAENRLRTMRIEGHIR
ncbi:MAG: tol-pal system protein YbgF [Lysobacterales bacterium]